MEKFYVTDGRYNYFESDSYEEAYKRAEEMRVHDIELRDFYMKKDGYIPDNVDIHPEGYAITTNRRD